MWCTGFMWLLGLYGMLSMGQQEREREREREREHMMKSRLLSSSTFDAFTCYRTFLTSTRTLLACLCCAVQEFQLESLEFFVSNCKRWARQEPLLNIVDKHAGY